MARSKQTFARNLSYSTVAAFVAAAFAATAHAGTLAVGPVEQVNLKASTVVVLGQTYHIDAASVIKNQAGAPVALGALAPNTLVSIDGTENAAGQTAVTSVTSIPQLDVPGATQLRVTGIVSSEAPTGQIKVGNLTVDITSTLTSDTPKFQVGNLVEITGTQPNPGGLFLAQNVIAVAGVDGGGSSALALGVDGGGHSSASVLGVDGGGHSSASVLGVDGGGHSSASVLGVDGGGHNNAVKLGVDGGGHSSASVLGVDGGGHSSASVLGVDGGGKNGHKN